MNKKIFLIFLAMLILFGAFFLLNNKNEEAQNSIPDPVSEIENELTLKNKNESPSSSSSILRNKSNVNTIENSQFSKRNEQADAEKEETIFVTNEVILLDKDGHKETIKILSLDQVKDKINFHQNEKPNEEFDSLSPMLFKNPLDSFMAGYFTFENKMEIFLSYLPENFVVSPYSCVYFPEKGVFKFDSSQIEIRGDGNGYAMISIADSIYIRFNLAENPIEIKTESQNNFNPDLSPIIYAQIWKRKNLDWVLAGEYIGKSSNSPPPNASCRSSL